MDKFIEIICKIYNYINKDFLLYEKNQFIDNCKKHLSMDIGDTFSNRYYKLIQAHRKGGTVYTPDKIADFLVKNLINKNIVLDNPYLKILDPSCGCGNLLIRCFLYLRNIFYNNIDKINNKNSMNLSVKNIEEHILKYNLFGFDVDVIAIKILKIDLFRLCGILDKSNFLQTDFLTCNIKDKYDFIIGNPPYIGHKSMDKNYAKLLKKKYVDVYEDKGDISYCFLKKAMDCMDLTGELSFVMSRYFCESISGKKLRIFIKENSSIKKIVDFYGIRPFKNVGIDAVIIFLKKERNNCKNIIQIIKPKSSNNIIKCDSMDFFNFKDKNITFFIGQQYLDSNGWILINEDERKIVEKIIKKSDFLLSDICKSNQGIITGCDRAFILDTYDIISNNIEKNIVKPWIKGSYIEKYQVVRKGKYIIYSNNIKDEKYYENSIKYIGKYRKILQKRRECRNGNRKWYELQWGRKSEIFEGNKIVFPYKASCNKFALDSGSYFSADTYCLTIKNESQFSYNMILHILNSKIYEFYFKTFAKKMGKDLYEYYPNKIMKLRIPFIYYNLENNDEYLYDFFNLTRKEVNIVKKYTNND